MIFYGKTRFRCQKAPFFLLILTIDQNNLIRTITMEAYILIHITTMSLEYINTQQQYTNLLLISEETNVLTWLLILLTTKLQSIVYCFIQTFVSLSWQAR